MNRLCKAEDHDYRPLNDKTIFCRRCGTFQAAGPTVYPYYPYYPVYPSYPVYPTWWRYGGTSLGSPTIPVAGGTSITYTTGNATQLTIGTGD